MTQPTNEKVTEAIAESKTVAHRIYVNWVSVTKDSTIFFISGYPSYPAIQCMGYAQAGQWFSAEVQGQQ